MICMLQIIEKNVRGSTKEIILFKGVYVGKRLGTPDLEDEDDLVLNEECYLI